MVLESSCSLCCGGLLFYDGCVHYHVDVCDSATHTLQGADGSGYGLFRGGVLCAGGVFRDFGVLRRDLLRLGLTLTMSIGVLSFCNLVISLSVVFLVHPLSLVSLLKYLSASLTATS